MEQKGKQVAEEMQPKTSQGTEPKEKKKSKRLLLMLILLLLLLLGGCTGFLVWKFAGGDSGGMAALAAELSAEGKAAIELDGDVAVTEPLIVNGEKTITGNGRIYLSQELDGAWPEGSSSSWAMGCPSVEAEDSAQLPALIVVSEGASLTLADSVEVDAADKANAILVEKGGAFTIQEKAVVQNGRYVNITVAEGAVAIVEGGEIADGEEFGIINDGQLTITDGTISGKSVSALVYTTGTAVMDGGTVTGSGNHNVYVAAGSFTMTDGLNDKAAKDGVLVAKGAKGEVTGGIISNCNHGLCNSGNMNAGAVSLNECGIMNYATGELELVGTTVDTAAVYLLANNGGKVTATDFIGIGCDTCAVYNFSGEMVLNNPSITKSRSSNISSTGGTLTVNGGLFDKSKDRSVVIGNGIATFNNVAVAGTSGEKNGVYIFGGELYMNDCTVTDVSSTAVKADPGCYVELNGVVIDGAANNGIHSDGGKIVATDCTIKNVVQNGIYNNQGDITLIDSVMSSIENNFLLNRDGAVKFYRVVGDGVVKNGLYVDKGTVTMEDSTFRNVGYCGVYTLDSSNEVVLRNVTFEDMGQQGINNSSKVTATNVTILRTGRNGIYNKEAGTLVVNGAKISDTEQNGISNEGTVTVKNTQISNILGERRNGIYNIGTMTAEKVTVCNTTAHGIYNKGTITVADANVSAAGDNGIHADGGQMTMDTVTIRDVTNHAIYNNKGDIVMKNAAISDITLNAVMNRAGNITLTDSTVEDIGLNGAYVDKGIVTVTNSAFCGITNSGIYTLDSDNEIRLTNVSFKNLGEQGINNSSKVTASNVTITGAEKNGIYNKEMGSVTADGLKISNVKQNGISNTGTMAVKNVEIWNVTEEKRNGIYNIGSMTVEKATIWNTKAHGIYNNGTMAMADADISAAGDNGIHADGGRLVVDTANIRDITNHAFYNNKGNIEASNITVNNVNGDVLLNRNGIARMSGVTASKLGTYGIYVDAGTVTVENSSFIGIVLSGFYITDNENETIIKNVEISDAREQGINNSSKVTASSVTITDVDKNGIFNKATADMAADGVTIIGTGQHGINNQGLLTLTNADLADAGMNCLNNSGDLTARQLIISGTADRGIYNSGYAELYRAKIDGSNATGTYLIDNAGGVLDLNDATVEYAYRTALYNRNGAAASVTNVIIDHAGNYGIYVASGCSLSGDGLVVNHVTKAASGTEGIAIKNAGKVSMLDHATVGDYDEAVTGYGSALADTADSGIPDNNAVHLDSGSFSGYDLVIKNVGTGASGNGIYNNGTIYVKDLVVDTASYGLVCRRDGWATLTGNNSLVNLTVNGIRTFGKDDGSGYDNGVTLYSGATLVIDGTGGHGINNKGSFLAAADTELTVKNVSGNNSNAINNTGNTAKMSLGNTVIDGLHVNVTMYNDTTMNTSAGNGMVSSGTVTLNGALEIRNVYTVTPDNRTENSVGSGIVVKSGGLVTGTGSIIVIGSGTGANEAGERGIFNGIFVQKNTLSIQGDITVENVRSQGIYAADADALVEGGNISVKDAGGNGIFINNTTGAVNATGAITVDGASLNGINNNSGGDITADSISIANTIGGYNGISSGGGGKITVAKNIAIANIGGTSAGTGQGNGINVSSGVITAGGNVVITGVTASGNTDNTSNNGITGKGQLNAGGDITIGAVAAGHGVFMDTGSVNAGGNITVEGSGSGRQGIYLANGNASMTAADISVANSGGNGIWIRSATDSMTATGTIQVTSPAVGRGINNVGTITAANIQVSEVLGNYNGIENTGTMNITGDYVKVDNVAGTYGIRNNGGAIYAPAASIYVSNINVAGTAGIGLQMENASILQAAEIWVDTVSSQGIQLSHANTLTAERVVILNATKQNGLRIYNANSNPDITITELVVYNCGGYAAAAAKAITETNLHITTLWYQDCKNIVHGNIKSGIGEVKEGIPEFVAAALSSAANTEGGN